MFTIAIKTAAGNTFYAVSKSKRSLYAWKAKQANVYSWRYHDGSGWADGSEEAWKDFDGIVGKMAEIVL